MRPQRIRLCGDSYQEVFDQVVLRRTFSFFILQSTCGRDGGGVDVFCGVVQFRKLLGGRGGVMPFMSVSRKSDFFEQLGGLSPEDGGVKLGVG